MAWPSRAVIAAARVATSYGMRTVALLRVRALSFRAMARDDHDPAHALLIRLRVWQPRDRLFAAVLADDKGAGHAGRLLPRDI